ncbi:MAG: SprT family protein [Tuberibacillus sp.]
MEQEDLQRLVEEISLNLFGKPFRHKAVFNKRLRTTGGRYLLQSHHLEFNPSQLAEFGLEEFKKIIIHELCHYHLHLEGKGYRHGDRDFKDLLKRTGGTRFCKVIPRLQNQIRIIYLYQCKDCGLEYPRRRKVNTRKYVCGKCRGRLALKATKHKS